MERRRSLAVREALKPGSCLPSPTEPNPLTSLPILDTKDLRYCFQHPYLRLFTTLTIIFCNFLLFAEDPISHSRTGEWSISRCIGGGGYLTLKGFPLVYYTVINHLLCSCFFRGCDSFGWKCIQFCMYEISLRLEMGVNQGND